MLRSRGSAAEERSRIAGELDRQLGDSRHAVRQFGDALLWLEDRDDQVTVAWVSTLGLRRFLKAIESGSEEIPLTASRVSERAPVVDEKSLHDPAHLSKAQAAAIYLVRAELPNAVIVWERTGERHSDIAVQADTWERAEQHLATFVSRNELQFVAQSVDDFRKLSA